MDNRANNSLLCNRGPPTDALLSLRDELNQIKHAEKGVLFHLKVFELHKVRVNKQRDKEAVLHMNHYSEFFACTW